MIPFDSGVKVWLATGHTDMRRGFPGLALQVQEILKQDPFCGHLFCFRGRRSNHLKVIWHDGQGSCTFTKKLERVTSAELLLASIKRLRTLDEETLRDVLSLLSRIESQTNIDSDDGESNGAAPAAPSLPPVADPLQGGAEHGNAPV